MYKSKLFIIILIGLASLMPNIGFLSQIGKYTLTFADVEQGDAVLIRTPTNCQLIVDAGIPNLLTDQISKYLPANEQKIDLLILSHPHLDHMGGQLQLLKRYNVENVFTTGVTYNSAFYTEYKNLLNQENAQIHYVKEGDTYNLCGLIIEVIYPKKVLISQELENVNNASIVLRIKIKDKWVYLSGDAELEVEEEILKTNKDLSAYIMKAGHHGSRTSNSGDILKRVSPEHIVIQSGEGNSYGHPHHETLDKANMLGIKIHRNDVGGTISFSF